MPAIAGPGAGKTRSIQLRAVNLLLMGQAATGELVLCTFGRDAASELQRRFVLHQEFDAIFGPGWDIVSKCGWRDGVHTAAEAARYLDRICDELIGPRRRPVRTGLSLLHWGAAACDTGTCSKKREWWTSPTCRCGPNACCGTTRSGNGTEVFESSLRLAREPGYPAYAGAGSEKAEHEGGAGDDQHPGPR